MPASHAVHVVPPVLARASVTWPASHVEQIVAPADENFPAAQGVAVVAPLLIAVPLLLDAYEPAATFAQAVDGLAEYLPEVHAVHVVAAVESVSVTLPAAHVAQATCEEAVYVPASHAVHVVPPVPVSVLVTWPAAQVEQIVAPADEYFPAAQSVAVVAPLLVAVPPLLDAYEPAATCVVQDVAEVEEE